MALPEPEPVKWWNPFSWREAQAHSNAADERLAQINEDDREQYGETWHEEVVANNARDTAQVNVASDIVGAAAEGAADGLKKITDAVRNPFAAIPPAWLFIGLIALFLYAGGAVWLKGILAKGAK